MKIKIEFDGRVNIVMLIISLCLIVTYRGFLFNGLIIFLSAMTVWFTQRSLKDFVKRITEPLFIGFVVVAIKAGLPLHFYIDGLLQGIQIFLKILASVSMVSLFFYFTPFHEILYGLKFLRIPSTFMELLFLTGRFILILQTEAERIYNAQKQRLGYTGFRRALKSIATLSASLISNALKHSEQSFIAMKQRGYDGEIVIKGRKNFALSCLIPFYILPLLVVLWLTV